MEIQDGINIVGICKGISVNDGGYASLCVAQIHKDEFGDEQSDKTYISLSQAMRDKFANQIEAVKGKKVIVNFAQRMQTSQRTNNRYLNQFIHGNTQIQELKTNDVSKS